MSILLFAGAQALSSAHFGAGSGSIILSYVNCGGNEARLISCQHSMYTHCSHSHDASVRCQIRTSKWHYRECMPFTIKL